MATLDAEDILAIRAEIDAAIVAVGLNGIADRIGDPSAEISSRWGANTLLGRLAVLGAQMQKMMVRGMQQLVVDNTNIIVTPELGHDSAYVYFDLHWMYQAVNNTLSFISLRIAKYDRVNGVTLNPDSITTAQVVCDATNYICIWPHKADTATRPGTGSAWQNVWALGGDGSTGAWASGQIYKIDPAGKTLSADAVHIGAETGGVDIPETTVEIVGGKYPFIVKIPPVTSVQGGNFDGRVGVHERISAVISTQDATEHSGGLSYWTPLDFSSPVVVPTLAGAITQTYALSTQVLRVVRGDSFRLTFNLGSDCTGWTPNFGMRVKRTGVYIVSSKAAVWVDAALGTGYIDVTAAENTTAGTMDGEIELSLGAERTTPLKCTIVVLDDVVK